MLHRNDQRTKLVCVDKYTYYIVRVASLSVSVATLLSTPVGKNSIV